MRRYFLALYFVGIASMPHYFHATDTSKPPTYVVILAGGCGERLWPLSRRSRPKQLLSIETSQTLLEQAIQRAHSLADSPEHILIVTTALHEKEVRYTIGHLVGQIIVEPAARNTGPAIVLCCLEITRSQPNATVLFLPADAFIPSQDHSIFLDALTKAVDTARTHDAFCLVGLQPTYPATGYGYIEYCQDAQAFPAYRITQFKEKPALPIAEEYFKQSTMLWNTGIFAGQVSHFIAEFWQHAPDLLDQVQEYLNGTQLYHTIPAISIDYAIMEKSSQMYVVPSQFTWCDIGNMGVFLTLKNQHKKLLSKTISIDACDNLVDVPDKLTALVGVDDLCIVQTDDVLLITKREHAEHIRAVVDQLKQDKLEEYL